MTTVVGPELLGDLAGLTVRQGEEDDVVTGQGLGVVALEDPVGERHQVRLQRAQRFPRVGAAGQGADPDVGVAEEQAQHLAAGVPTGTGDGDGIDCMCMTIHDAVCRGYGVAGIARRV